MLRLTCLVVGLALLQSAIADPAAQLLAEATDMLPWLQNIRRTLHRRPELMYEEEKTSEYLREQLTELGISYRHPVAKTGIVATIGSGAPKFALRTDIDALPILEETGLEFASETEGKMHACGHDGHMTMLLGAAKLLKAREGSLKGTVVLLFQPAEEGGAGGKKMVEEGALEGVLGAHGIHVWPTIPSGTITSKDGPIMAGATMFQVTIHGRGGHGAMPHLTTDPVIAAAAIINALQSLVSRETSPTDSAVISVTRLSTGEGATNVIPDSVRMGGTMRALTMTHLDKMHDRIEQVVEATAGAHGCNTTIFWRENPYPPTMNTPAMVSLVEKMAGRLGTAANGVAWERLTEPTMAGEDFSFIANTVPAAFTFLGIGNESAGSVHGLHTSRFILDESQLPLGVALHASVALDFLSTHQPGYDGREEL